MACDGLLGLRLARGARRGLHTLFLSNPKEGKSQRKSLSLPLSHHSPSVARRSALSQACFPPEHPRLLPPFLPFPTSPRPFPLRSIRWLAASTSQLAWLARSLAARLSAHGTSFPKHERNLISLPKKIHYTVPPPETQEGENGQDSFWNFYSVPSFPLSSGRKPRSTEYSTFTNLFRTPQSQQGSTRRQARQVTLVSFFATRRPKPGTGFSTVNPEKERQEDERSNDHFQAIFARCLISHIFCRVYSSQKGPGEKKGLTTGGSSVFEMINAMQGRRR